MLQITVPAARFFNEKTEEFIESPALNLRLEHSLISVSKWESKWHKSFLNAGAYTREEFLDYVRCMSLDPNVTYDSLIGLGYNEIEKITKYIHEPMTATTFHNQKKETGRSIITAEIIYYWMITFEIPFECEKWHLNRLLTLINVCSIKQNPSKMNKRDAAMMRMMANESRRKKFGTKG